jgi:pimeloyl-ACP methyl ester carboxylesterase
MSASERVVENVTVLERTTDDLGEFRTIAHAGRKYVLAQAGEGPDIVLLHGFPDTPYSWREIASALVAAGWRVSLPWLRGYHPETIVPGIGYGADALAHDGAGVIEAIGASSAVLVGHDWGAFVTYTAASLAPDRVRAIVTVGIPHPSVLRPTPAGLWEIRHFAALKLPWAARTARRNDFAYFERLYRRWAPHWTGSERDETLSIAKRALWSPATLDGAISYYRDAALGRLPEPIGSVPAVPGLIIGGDHGPGHGLYERTAELLPEPSRALIVPGAGHWPHRENSALVLPQLLEFLGGLQ